MSKIETFFLLETESADTSTGPNDSKLKKKTTIIGKLPSLLENGELLVLSWKVSKFTSLQLEANCLSIH